MKRHFLATGLTLALALGLPAKHALAAYMRQDTPTNTSGVQAVCTGVGSAKSDPRWADYPVRTVFSNEGGQYIAGEHVLLSQGGKQITAFDCDAPWVLFRLPAGRYSVTATLPGEPDTRSHTVTFATNDGGLQKVVEVTFPRLPPNQ